MRLLTKLQHTIDHIAGLARTSVSPPRFIFMGGDIGHHVSTWRPNEYLPLPNELEPSPLGIYSKFNIRLNVCPGELFVNIHPEHSDNSPFLKIKGGHPWNLEMARSALKSMEPFDADENIMVITAHDYTLLPILSFWPKEANVWYEENWGQKGRWEFLKDFAENVGSLTTTREDL